MNEGFAFRVSPFGDIWTKNNEDDTSPWGDEWTFTFTRKCPPSPPPLFHRLRSSRFPSRFNTRAGSNAPLGHVRKQRPRHYATEGFLRITQKGNNPGFPWPAVMRRLFLALLSQYAVAIVAKTGGGRRVGTICNAQ